LAAVVLGGMVAGGDREASREAEPADVPGDGRRRDRPVRQEDADTRAREDFGRGAGELRRQEPGVVADDDAARVSGRKAPVHGRGRGRDALDRIEGTALGQNAPPPVGSEVKAGNQAGPGPARFMALLSPSWTPRDEPREGANRAARALRAADGEPRERLLPAQHQP